jgi:hypothetical protein
VEHTLVGVMVGAVGVAVGSGVGKGEGGVMMPTTAVPAADPVQVVISHSGMPNAGVCGTVAPQGHHMITSKVALIRHEPPTWSRGMCGRFAARPLCGALGCSAFTVSAGVDPKGVLAVRVPTSVGSSVSRGVGLCRRVQRPQTRDNAQGF